MNDVENSLPSCLVHFNHAKFVFVMEIAGVGGYGYLLEPLWWVGMVTSTFLIPLSSSFFTAYG
jgi:hypothetical protein